MFTMSTDLTCSGMVSGSRSGIPQISKEIFLIFPQEKCSQHDCSGCSNLGQASFRGQASFEDNFQASFRTDKKYSLENYCPL
jgi:hypothetical protein